jgi:hypothetical protein
MMPMQAKRREGIVLTGEDLPGSLTKGGDAVNGSDPNDTTQKKGRYCLGGRSFCPSA